MMLFPLLTEADPVTASEGSIDPLGLYTIADSLAMRMVPGIRERQLHPRFLTAIAVSLEVCGKFDEEIVAADGVSEPWQVFEWYLVEGMVRTAKEDKQLRGLPGREKSANAIKDKVPLSASRYLKIPSVYGFHGVYRLLSKTIGIEVAEQLGDAGYELLSVWTDEQGLSGFHGTVKGPGSTWRRNLESAVEDGLKKGAVARAGGWSGWTFFRDYLAHFNPGPKERQVIWNFLVDPKDGFRGTILQHLISDEGQKVWRPSNSEEDFHKYLLDRVDPDLKELLEAIIHYEIFSRFLQDAFEDCLFLLSKTRGKTSPRQLCSSPFVQEASKRLPSLFSKLLGMLIPYGESIRFQESFSELGEQLSPEEWVGRLIEHHMKIQRKKPPNGKAPWFERFDDGSCIIRPAYLRHSGVEGSRGYVHDYRANPLWSFAQDLGMVE